MEQQEKLVSLFKQWSGDFPRTIVPLPLSGSARKYYRLANSNSSLIGVYNADQAENHAFIAFARHFKQKGLRVPEVYLTDPETQFYLQEDLGDVILFDLLAEEAIPGEGASKKYLEQALEHLSAFQMLGHRGLNYDLAYPRKAFDVQSMRWDLNYFKYHFLKFTGIVFDEQKLETDFETLLNWLKKAPRRFFLYRDFQSRHIMIKDDQVWFIDFQGGRKGYPAYDVASLLFDAKANLGEELRNHLEEHYLSFLPPKCTLDKDEFRKYYPGFVLIRKLQAMGAFGFRGIFERKTHFLQSIPYALRNARWLVTHMSFDVDLPELSRVLTILPDTPFLTKIQQEISTLEK